MRTASLPVYVDDPEGLAVLICAGCERNTAGFGTDLCSACSLNDSRDFESEDGGDGSFEPPQAA